MRYGRFWFQTRDGFRFQQMVYADQETVYLAVEDRRIHPTDDGSVVHETLKQQQTYRRRAVGIFNPRIEYHEIV